MIVELSCVMRQFMIFPTAFFFAVIGGVIAGVFKISSTVSSYGELDMTSVLHFNLS